VNRRRFLAGACLLCAARAIASEGYPPVVPGRPLAFPRDFGSHPEFRNEWWYVTGWVRDVRGAEYGVQVTFFRNRPRVAEANASRFAPRQLIFAHAAVADPALGRLRHDQRAAREGFGLAGASGASTDVRIGDWSLALADGAYDAHVEAREFRLDLRFAQKLPVLLEGEAGFSRKDEHPANASYYYSEPQLAVTGTIELDGKRIEVAGIAWLDHEWSSEVLSPQASGWDWTGINFNDGAALMAFRIRDRAGSALWAGGAFRAPDGRTRGFAPQEIVFAPERRWRSTRTGVEYPVAMRVRAGELDYTLAPLMDDQELDSRASTGTIYWEGAVRASRAGREIGRGYLELTGYGQPLRL
jgi:predicted secreted hydrolase